jgi:hypothetical protein
MILSHHGKLYCPDEVERTSYNILAEEYLWEHLLKPVTILFFPLKDKKYFSPIFYQCCESGSEIWCLFTSGSRIRDWEDSGSGIYVKNI